MTAFAGGVRPIPVLCGIVDDGPPCVEDLWRTAGPASTLRCSVHGDVLDTPPPPPLTGVVFVDGPDYCGPIAIEDLR